MTTAMVSCSGILSVIICKHQLAELKWKRFQNSLFSYTIPPKVLDNDFEFSKIDFKKDLRKIFKWSKNKFTLKQVLP
jgi:hypothetical protein